MSSVQQKLEAAQNQAPKRKPFRKQIYRGIELDKLLEKSTEEMVSLLCSRQRRRFKHGMHLKYDKLKEKLIKSVKESRAGEKPKAVKTHLRNAIVMPEMVGSVVEVYSGKYWTPVEVRADMIGHYFAEFSMSYKPVRHGKVGKGATRGSKFITAK